MIERRSCEHVEQGFIESVVMSIFEPGVNKNVLLVMNFALIALFFVLVGLAIMTNGNLHVFVLIVLTVGLFCGIQWFMSELKSCEEEERIAKAKYNASIVETSGGGKNEAVEKAKKTKRKRVNKKYT